jgi:hypothetical protein
MKRLPYLAVGLLVWAAVAPVGAAVPEDERRRQTEVGELLGQLRLLEALATTGQLDALEREYFDRLAPFVARECPDYFRRHLEPYLERSVPGLVNDPSRANELAQVRRSLVARPVPDPEAWKTPIVARSMTDDDAGLWLMVCWGAWSQSGLGRAWDVADPAISDAEQQRRLALRDTFDPAALEPATIVSLASAARARGVVLVTRHLDGVPWFQPPGADDPLTRMVAALRREGLRVGLYYCLVSFRSPDGAWSPYHPRYAPCFSTAFPERWQRFVDATLADLDTLVDRYQPDVIWLDERWPLSDSAQLWSWMGAARKRVPGLTFNDRGTAGQADFATYEDVIPRSLISGPWEAVIAISNGPGFWHRANPVRGFKSGEECIALLARAREHGARLLLSVAPDGRGGVEPAEATALQELGEWIGRRAADP